MLVTALLFLGLAIVAWRFTQIHVDDVGRFLGSLAALTFLIAGLATAPLLLRGVVLLGLLVYPNCSAQLSLGQRPKCPHFCLFRTACNTSAHHQTRDRF